MSHDDLIAALSEAHEALIRVHDLARNMRHSAELVGPREYEKRPDLMKAWQRARYRDGKDVMDITRTAKTAVAVALAKAQNV